MDYPFWAQLYQSGEIIEAKHLTAAVPFAEWFQNPTTSQLGSTEDED